MKNLLDNAKELIRKVQNNEPMGYYLYTVIDTMGGIAYVGSTENIYYAMEHIKENEEVSTIFKANEWESIIALDVEELLLVNNSKAKYSYTEQMELLEYILYSEYEPTLTSSKWEGRANMPLEVAKYSQSMELKEFVNLCDLINPYKDYSLWEIYQENDNI